MMDTKKFLIILAISLVYLTFSLACDPLAYRLITFFGITISGSVMLYSGLYPMLDMLTRLLGKYLTIIMILLFHFCDFLYSYALFFVNKMPHPATFHHVQAYNIVITPIPRMFWAGIVGSVVAGIIEVLIYALLQNRVKNFFIASFISTILVVLGHGIPTDYFAFNKAFPHQVWQLVFSNIFVNCIVLTIYVTLAFLVMKVIGKRYYQNVDTHIEEAIHS